MGRWRPGEHPSLRELDTPSLLGLRRSAPYLPDGRTATLDAVLTAHNADDRHGVTSPLSKDDVEALVLFLTFFDARSEN